MKPSQSRPPSWGHPGPLRDRAAKRRRDQRKWPRERWKSKRENGQSLVILCSISRQYDEQWWQSALSQKMGVLHVHHWITHTNTCIQKNTDTDLKAKRHKTLCCMEGWRGADDSIRSVLHRNRKGLETSWGHKHKEQWIYLREKKVVKKDGELRREFSLSDLSLCPLVEM